MAFRRKGRRITSELSRKVTSLFGIKEAGVTKLEKLGEGGYGEVWKVYHPASQKVYAMKKIRISNLNQKILNLLYREVEVMLVLSSALDCIPSLKAIEYGPREWNLFMKYIKGRDLMADFEADLFLPLREGDSRYEKVYSWEERLNLMLQMAHCLKIVHQHGVAHRDLKPENIMLTTQNKIYLVDYGLACLPRLKPGDYPVAECQRETGGTAYYAPPEVFRPPSEKVDYRESDIFSLGVIFFTIMSNLLIHSNDDSPRQLYDNTLRAPTTIFQWTNRNFRGREDYRRQILEVIIAMVGQLGTRPGIEEVIVRLEEIREKIS